ncbi:MAG: hypothetical protein R3Y61_02945 [Rikenellaceae bacterium]
MKRNLTLLFAFVCIFTVACSGSASLSDSEVLEHIDKKFRAEYYVGAKLSLGLVKNKDLDYRVFNYQEAGLITLTDTVIRRRYYTDVPAQYVQLTEKGKIEIIEYTDEENIIHLYSYNFDNIEDVLFLGSRADEDFDATYEVYTVFFSGTVTETSAFGVAVGAEKDQYYPLSNQSFGRPLMACQMVVLLKGAEIMGVYIDDVEQIYVYDEGSMYDGMKLRGVEDERLKYFSKSWKSKLVKSGKW